MLLSEMFGVERDTDFGVKGYESLFKVTLNAWGEERLMFKLPCVSAWEPVSQGTLCSVIFAAPAGIIRLPPPLTDEQREQLRALYTLGYRWLAKDENGATYAYDKQKLAKGLTIWLSQKRGCSRIHDGMAEDVIIPLVSWSDTEPYDIAKALGVGE